MPSGYGGVMENNMANKANDLKLSNIPQMNVGKMTELLSGAYSSLINNNISIKKMPSVMLWGPPGVGKS